MALNTGFICGPEVLSFHSTSTHLPPIFWHLPLTGRSPGHVVSDITPVLLDLSNPSSSRINLLGLPRHQSACLLSSVVGANKSSRLCNQQGVNKSVSLLTNSSIHLWCISHLNAYLIGVGVFLEREAKVHVGIQMFCNSLCQMLIMHSKLEAPIVLRVL